MLISRQSALGSWQAKNWDPKVGSTKFDEFCESLKKPIFGGSEDIAALPIGHDDRLVPLSNNFKIDFTVLNYAKWIKEVRMILVLLF